MLSTNWLLKLLGTFVEQYSYSISLWIKYCVNPVGLLPFRLSFPNSLFPLLIFSLSSLLTFSCLLQLLTIPGVLDPCSVFGQVFSSRFLPHSPCILCILLSPADFGCNVFSFGSLWCGGLTKTEAFCSNDLFSFVCWFLINNDSSVTLNQAAICSEKQGFACNVDPQCGSDSVCRSVCASVYLTPHLFQWPSDVVLALTYCSRKNRGQDVCII